MPTPCPDCSEPIARSAKFCPRCGRKAPERTDPHRSIDFGKMSAPIPPAGILFLVALVVGPCLIVVGFATGVTWLIYAGIVVLILLTILAVLGSFL